MRKILALVLLAALLLATPVAVVQQDAGAAKSQVCELWFTYPACYWCGVLCSMQMAVDAWLYGDDW